MPAVKHLVLTVGHSSHSFENFLALLQRHCVTALADVRSSPYSRFSTQFNREVLAQGLNSNGIKYVFLGRELGARSDDRACYENGRVQYARLASTQLFRAGIQRVIRGAMNFRLALMCTEKEPLECHRTLLISPVLVRREIAVQHILEDGQLEPHDVTMERLLRVVGLRNLDLFRSRDSLIEEALIRQGERVAYVDEKLIDSKRESL